MNQSLHELTHTKKMAPYALNRAMVVDGYSISDHGDNNKIKTPDSILMMTMDELKENGFVSKKSYEEIVAGNKAKGPMKFNPLNPLDI